MRHSWLSTSSECFLKSCRGKSRGIQKTLSLIRAANNHNIPGMYSSVLVVDTWLIHVHQICSQCWLLGDVPAMFSLYTYHHLPKCQHALWYSPNWIQRVSRVSSGAKDYITLLLSNHLQSLRATLWKCFLNQRQTTDWVPIEGSWMTQNIMFSNMWKFATTVRENFDDLQILSSPS